MEELLELVEELPDGDEREDGLTLEAGAEIPAASRGGVKETGDGGTDGPSPETGADSPPEDGARALWADAGTDAQSWWEETPEAEGREAGEAAAPAREALRPDGGADAAASPAGKDAQGPEEGWRPGAPHWQGDKEEQSAPVWWEAEKRRSGLDWRRAEGRLAVLNRPEEEARRGFPARRETEPPHSATAGMEETERGLEKLYRQTAQAARPVPQAMGGEQAVRMVRTGEAETARQLTVDELDRAVRRDSRRYDGGMAIF